MLENRVVTEAIIIGKIPERNPPNKSIAMIVNILKGTITQLIANTIVPNEAKTMNFVNPTLSAILPETSLPAATELQNIIDTNDGEIKLLGEIYCQ